jgi:hypothetical protein
LGRALAVKSYIPSCDFIMVNNHIKTSTIIKQSKKFTQEQLRKELEKKPDDYITKVMLAERMDNWEEKIEYIRKNLVTAEYLAATERSRNRSELTEWMLAWDRLHKELPTYSFIEPNSLYELPIPQTLNLQFAQGDWFGEKICQVCDYCDENGNSKQGFVDGFNRENNIQKFDRIIKLTYRHFWCQQDSIYHTLYYSPDESFFIPVTPIMLEGELTLEKILAVISANYPEIYSTLTNYLYKDLDRDAYISIYRNYEWGFDDIFLPLAVRRVIIDNFFHVKPLDTLSCRYLLSDTTNSPTDEIHSAR